MSEPLSRLMYSSRLLSDDMEAGVQADRIARCSAARNAAHGITGVLVFVDNTFIQVLEGPRDEVEATFERICSDLRHSDVRLIDVADTDAPLFPEWHMACLGGEEDQRIALQNELHELRFMTGVNARQAMMQMRELLDRERTRTPQRAAA